MFFFGLKKVTTASGFPRWVSAVATQRSRNQAHLVKLEDVLS